jgi:hypothetical protein
VHLGVAICRCGMSNPFSCQAMSLEPAVQVLPGASASLRHAAFKASSKPARSQLEASSKPARSQLEASSKPAQSRAALSRLMPIRT